MAGLLIELHYLPSVAWFAMAAQADAVVVEQYENFQKQSYRNRCLVRGAHRIETLIVPLTGKHGKTGITDVLIDHTQRWTENHWRTIESAYRKSPFFEHYEEDFHELLFTNESTLFEFNWKLLKACLHWLGLDVPLRRTSTFQKAPDAGTLDLRNTIDAKHPAKIKRLFRPQPYQQVFGDVFAENLSIIDLLFCAGPRALELVRASATREA